MNLLQFKDFVLGVIKAVDARASQQAVAIADLSAKCAEQAATIQNLTAALAAKDEAAAQALAAQAQEQANALDSLSTEIAAAANPTPAADAVAVAVTESPAIETPAVVEDSETLNTPESTEPAVLDAAVVAIEEAVEVEEAE